MTEKPKVYFTKEISSEKLIELYKKLDIKLEGNIAVKVHSGEKGNQNFLRPEFMKPLVDYLDGTIVETNTSGPEYISERNTNEKHKKLLEEHGWTKVFKKVEILDAEQPDEEIDIPNGIMLKKNYIGSKTKNYDGFLVLAHFKGHVMGGYGGALKQLSIGFGSRLGKTLMHSGGKSRDPEEFQFKRKGNEKTVVDITVYYKITAICNSLFTDNLQLKMTLNNLRKIRNEGEHRCQVIWERRDESNNLYQFLQTATFNSVRTALLKVVSMIEVVMQERVVEGVIKTMLPSVCFVLYDDKTEELPNKLFSKIRQLKVGDNIKLTLFANKIVDVNI